MPIAVGDVWGSTLGVGLDAGTFGAHKGGNQVGCCAIVIAKMQLIIALHFDM